MHTGICAQNLKGVQKDQFACLVEILSRREFQRCASMEFGEVYVVMIGHGHQLQLGHHLMDKCFVNNSDIMTTVLLSFVLEQTIGNCIS